MSPTKKASKKKASKKVAKKKAVRKVARKKAGKKATAKKKTSSTKKPKTADHLRSNGTPKGSARWPAYTAVRRSVADLSPHPRNPRTHTEAQVEKIARSIDEWGWTNPVLIDEHGTIIAGHGRVQAAQLLDVEEVPCVVAEGWTEAQRRAYVIADNQLAIDAGWDNELLVAEFGELAELDFDLSLLGFDLWELGDHLLLCGDAVDPERTLAGREVDLIVTSPPYNQELDRFTPSGMHKDDGWVGKVQRTAYTDSRPEAEYQSWQSQLLAAWYRVVRDGGSVFYNHKNRYREKCVVSPMEWLPGPFRLRQEIVWSRPGSVTQNARMFMPCDERIFWLYRGADFHFDDSTEIKSYSTVWRFAPAQNPDHPAPFPLEIPERAIRACAPEGGVVMDPFSGSGTTMIACESLGRVFCGTELDPGHCDASILRWQAATGRQAVLSTTGQTFEEVAAERLAEVAEPAP